MNAWAEARAALLRGACVGLGAGGLGGLLGLAGGVPLQAAALAFALAGAPAFATAPVESWALRRPRSPQVACALAWLAATLAMVAGGLQAVYAAAALGSASPEAGVAAVREVIDRLGRASPQLAGVALAGGWFAIPYAATTWTRVRDGAVGEDCGCALAWGGTALGLLAVGSAGLGSAGVLVGVMLAALTLAVAVGVVATGTAVAAHWERTLVARNDPACAALLARAPSPPRLWLLAYLGDAPARRLLGARAPASERALAPWARRLWRAGTPGVARAAVALTRLELPALADPDARRRALELLDRLAPPPRRDSPRRAEEAERQAEAARADLAGFGPRPPAALAAAVEWSFSPDVSPREPLGPDGPYRRRVARAARLADLAADAAERVGEAAVREALEAELRAWARGEESPGS